MSSDDVTNTTELMTNMEIPQVPVIVPTTISLSDIMNATEILVIKENEDKLKLESIGNFSLETLKYNLIQWGSLGFPNVYTIMNISIVVPNICSDGTTRQLEDYIVFCSGKTIHDHVQLLQTKLVDITVSYANMGSHLAIVISK